MTKDMYVAYDSCDIFQKMERSGVKTKNFILRFESVYHSCKHFDCN
jgi:hypothetical protein